MGLQLSSIASLKSEYHNPRNNHFYGGEKQQLLVLSRGGSSDVERNTIEAIRQSIDEGCDGVQIDVRASSDGQLFCYGSETDDLMVKPRGDRVCEMKWSQIEQRHRSIPLLSSVLRAFNSNSLIHIVLHAQNPDIENGMDSRAHWGTLLGELLRELQVDTSSIMVTSFNLHALRNLHHIMKSVALGFNYSFDMELLLDEAEQAWFDGGSRKQEMNLTRFTKREVSSGEGFAQWAIANWGICCDHRPHCADSLNVAICFEKSQLEHSLVSQLHDAGFAVGVYTIYETKEEDSKKAAAQIRLAMSNWVDWIESSDVPQALDVFPEISRTSRFSRSSRSSR